MDIFRGNLPKAHCGHHNVLWILNYELNKPEYQRVKEQQRKWNEYENEF